MPKNKKKSDTESQSDSDSGPEDRNPTPSKKPKEDEKKAPTKKEGEKKWTLEKLRQVNINEFRGRQTIDIREFYEKNGDILPGKKGISLSISQWKKLLEYADEINANLE